MVCGVPLRWIVCLNRDDRSPDVSCALAVLLPERLRVLRLRRRLCWPSSWAGLRRALPRESRDYTPRGARLARRGRHFPALGYNPQPMKVSTSEFVSVRGLRYHLRHWGPAVAPRLFLLHGWMDVAASFQFLVDAFSREWHVIAPDWRGFGLSARQHGPYWFPDYSADLEALLDHYSPDEPARLVGHSMGGNIACLYAGARPQRVAKLATLEGFGLRASDPMQAPTRLAQWLDQLKSGVSFRDYADRNEFAQRLLHDNPRLKPEQAAFLAEHFVELGDDGRYRPAADTHQKMVNPMLYRLEEAQACWRAITAPVLWVAARDSYIMKAFEGHEADYAARLACFRDVREVVMEDCGHMMHHDQPQRLAAMLEAFMTEC